MPYSECIQQWCPDRVAFHFHRCETAQGKAGMSVFLSYYLSSFVGIQKTPERLSSDRISNWLNFDDA